VLGCISPYFSHDDPPKSFQKTIGSGMFMRKGEQVNSGRRALIAPKIGFNNGFPLRFIRVHPSPLGVHPSPLGVHPSPLGVHLSPLRAHPSLRSSAPKGYGAALQGYGARLQHKALEPVIPTSDWPKGYLIDY